MSSIATEKRRALVTGASSGIGRELARLFAADGHDLVLVARREPVLRDLATELEAQGIAVEVLPTDLADLQAPAQIIAEIEAKEIEIEWLVNCAGYGSNGEFWTLDRERELGMIDLNVRALVELSHRLLPAMVERGSGHVLNIASTAGFQAGPYMATYYASKAFVLHFSEALSHELRGSGVTATVHCPGATDTEFAGLASNDDTALFKARVIDAGTVAADAYAAMKRGDALRIEGLRNRFMAFSIRFAPRKLVASIAARLNR